MIGNDIVDLVEASQKSNWKRKGFLDKIFTAHEQLLISESENPEVLVWDLWSRKEAVYKIYNRQTGIRAFMPLQVKCFDIHEKVGKVICMEKTYFTKTETTSQYVHTIAVVEMSNFNKISVLDNTTEIRKANGIPFGSDNEIVSVSHHGRFRRVVWLMI